MAFASASVLSTRLSLLRASEPRGLSFITCQKPFSKLRGFCLCTRNVKKSQPRLSFLASRLASTGSLDSITNANEAAVVVHPPPDVAVQAEEAAKFTTDNLISHVPAALQYGDMAALGLASWTPAGIIRWSFEIINVATGLPWFWTIVAGSLLWRAVLVPFTVKGLQNSARLLPLQPQILRNQKEMDAIRKSGDKLALQRQALKMRKFYKDAGVSLGTTALMPFVQLPVTLGTFFGVKKLCELPLPQVINSGLDILPDLTVADPYMILPITFCALLHVQIQAGSAELNLRDRPEMGHLMNVLRFLSVPGIWFMSSLPSGLVVSMITTSLAITAQSLILQRPYVRKALNIPQVPAEFRGKLPSLAESVQYAITSVRGKVDEAKMAQQRQKKIR